MKPIDYGKTVWQTISEWGCDADMAAVLSKVAEKTSWHDRILCSISGGYDSDIMLDMLERFGGHGKTTYIFQDTGLEYDATKRHLADLAAWYGVEIVKLRPKKAIPVCVKTYGVPFWSKYVSQMLQRLQRHQFQWEDAQINVLSAKYPKCKAALRFWCNDFRTKTGAESRFNIAYVSGLKEFMIQNPPDFLISSKCCDYAKKDPARNFLKQGGFDMNCVGVRKSERGERSTAYTSCFDRGFGDLASQFRPLFWMTDKQKEEYREHFGLVRSDCYEAWGMKRTGCACCPFGKKFETELTLVQNYEPKLCSAAKAIFGPSYDYTRKFLAFRKTMNGEKAK